MVYLSFISIIVSLVIVIYKAMKYFQSMPKYNPKDWERYEREYPEV